MSFKKQVEKMSCEHEQLAERLQNIEIENKKIKTQSHMDEERTKKDKIVSFFCYWSKEIIIASYLKQIDASKAC